MSIIWLHILNCSYHFFHLSVDVSVHTLFLNTIYPSQMSTFYFFPSKTAYYFYYFLIALRIGNKIKSYFFTFMQHECFSLFFINFFSNCHHWHTCVVGLVFLGFQFRLKTTLKTCWNDFDILQDSFIFVFSYYLFFFLH